ncbi:hypothetical protein P691DRAFT_667850, partial [Macrolepiota fuliginosa MF-IS2]
MDTFLHVHGGYHETFCPSDIPASICQYCGTTLTGTTTIPPSPIPHLLGSNAIPTGGQGQLVRGAIGVAMVDIRRLEGEIRRVSSVLAQLQGEYRALGEHRRFTEVEDSFDPREGPLVLTQVCSAWRQTAIATPQLW